MATRGGKNTVTLTFAGDHDQLSKSFDQVGSSAEEMRRDVKRASESMGNDLNDGTRRVKRSTEEVNASFDRARERTDALDTSAMGFRDSLTGVQDSMMGTAALARGELFEGFFLLGAGIGDLASSATNLLVPALKSARAGLVRARKATVAFLTTARGATLALGAVGVAIGALVVAWQVLRNEQDQVQVSVEHLTDDLERFGDTGRVTGQIVKILGTDASDLKRRLDELDGPVRRNVSGWDDLLENFKVTSSEMDLLKEDLADLDQGLAQFVDAGGDGQRVLRGLADHYGLSRDELERVTEALPQYREALQRAKDEQKDATDIVLGHMESLKDLGDELKAQTDPVFAYAQAQRDVAEAQQGVKDALDEFGRSSPQYREALLGLTGAELDVVSATGDVQNAVDAGLLPTLRRLRDDGVLTEAGFRELVTTMEDAEQQAKELDGTRTRINIEQVISTSGQRVVTPMGGPVQAFHTGGHASGAHGREFMALLQAGERVTPAGGGRQDVQLRVQPGDGGGSVEQAVADLVLHLVRTGTLNLDVHEGRVVT